MRRSVYEFSLYAAVTAVGTALAAAGLLTMAGPAQAECSPDNWKDCAGKPWVDGKSMDTPLGSKWWPNPLWGAGDEAGSTNWYATRNPSRVKAVAGPNTLKRSPEERLDCLRVASRWVASEATFPLRSSTSHIRSTPEGPRDPGNEP